MRSSLSLIRSELCIGTGRTPPFIPHPVLPVACENKQPPPQCVLREKARKLHMTTLGEQEAFYFHFFGEKPMWIPTKTTNFPHT